MNILFLTIKRKWFDLIAEGVKKEEYRDIKPYYEGKLDKHYDAVLFQNGYSKTSPRLLIECTGIEKKNANPEWAGGYDGYCYAIKLGSILNVQR